MDRIAIISLVRIDLPTASIRLCDGGFITYGGDTYRGLDPVFGTIGDVRGLTEGIGDEIPALEMTLLPPMSSAPSDLSRPGYQNSIVQMMVGEYSETTGAFLSPPDLMFHGQIDQMTMIAGKERRELSLTIVSTAERMFLNNDGNTLTPRWHQSIWPGERGHDNAVGLTIPVAWGVESRPVASSGRSAGAQLAIGDAAWQAKGGIIN